MSVTSESGVGLDDTWGVETAGSGSLTLHQLRAHARCEISPPRSGRGPRGNESEPKGGDAAAEDDEAGMIRAGGGTRE